MNNDQGSKKQQIKKKITLGSVVLTVIYVVLLGSLLIGATSAKYIEKRTLFTDFDVAAFNAVILGADLNDTHESAKQKLKTRTIKAFAQNFDSEDFTPSATDVRILPFTISNGLDEYDASEVNADYSIKLRVTKNLPLNFKLNYKSTDSETGNSKTETYLPGIPQEVKVSSVKGDVLMYEYSFYRASVDDETKPDYAREARFDLPSGKNGLDLNLHSIEVRWPVKPAGTEEIKTLSGEIERRQTKITNDSSYMKEVELIEVYVSVVSKNATEKTGAKTRISEVPAVEPNAYYTTGLVYMIENNGTRYDISVNQLDTPYSYEYEVDYRAFRQEEGATGYRFPLQVDDGIRNIKNPDASEQEKYPQYSHYTIRLRVPVAAICDDDKIAFSNSNYCYTITTPDGKTLSKLESTYYEYDYHVYPEPTKVELADIDNDTAAIDYWMSQPKDSQTNHYIYRVDTFTMGSAEYINHNEIKHYDESTISRPVDYIYGHSDKFYITLNDSAAKETNRFNKIDYRGEYEAFSVDHKIYVDIDVVYSNNASTTLLPRIIEADSKITKTQEDDTVS